MKQDTTTENIINDNKDRHSIQPVAYLHSDFPSKFGIPRQSGLASSLRSRIIFEKEFRSTDALRGLSDFSHIWIIWGFSENLEKGWSLTVRPPRLGGNIRMGVFATRSPFRPNGLGLSSVKIEKILDDSEEGPIIIVSGADLMNKTPIYDIKPYISHDIHEDARCGFQENTRNYHLQVDFPEHLLSRIPENLRQGLLETLAQDPRPSYHHDPERIYGLPFDRFDIKFRVEEKILTVTDITPLSP